MANFMTARWVAPLPILYSLGFNENIYLLYMHGIPIDLMKVFVFVWWSNNRVDGFPFCASRCAVSTITEAFKNRRLIRLRRVNSARLAAIPLSIQYTIHTAQQAGAISLCQGWGILHATYGWGALRIGIHRDVGMKSALKWKFFSKLNTRSNDELLSGYANEILCG